MVRDRRWGIQDSDGDGFTGTECLWQRVGGVDGGGGGCDVAARISNSHESLRDLRRRLSQPRNAAHGVSPAGIRGIFEIDADARSLQPWRREFDPNYAQVRDAVFILLQK